MSKHTTTALNHAITDIDAIIKSLHQTTLDFRKGSINQRIITDLDGARVSARAALCLEENPDAKPE